MHFGFQRFLNLGNPWKPVKTRELGNLDTHVPFPGNLTNLYSMETSETQVPVSYFIDYCGYKFIIPINYS